LVWSFLRLGKFRILFIIKLVIIEDKSIDTKIIELCKVLIPHVVSIELEKRLKRKKPKKITKQIANEMLT
jgi:hypothetical protein